jgi:hypothetical protein
MAIVGLIAAPARADDNAACVEQHSRASDHLDAKRLRAAKRDFLACAREACPRVVREECAAALARVEQDLASVVVAAKGPDGEPTVDVSVSVDGERAVTRLGAEAIAVDPGERLFRFELASGERIEHKELIRQGEKNRLLSVDFSVHAPPPRSTARREEQPDTGLGAGFWVLGGVSVIGFASFGFFALDGRAKEDDLDCKPFCSEDQAEPMYRSYLIADISLAVGLVAGAAAAWIALDSGPDAPRETASRRSLALPSF